MVLIDTLFEMVTDVGAPLPVNVAVLSGTVGLELQLVPVVHSAPGPVHVPSTACADWGNSAANAPSHTPPSSAARVRAGRAAGAAAQTARPATKAAGADRRVRAACRCKPITPRPLYAQHGRNAPVPSSCRPHGLTNLRGYGCEPARSIRACFADADWPPAVALPSRGRDAATSKWVYHQPLVETKSRERRRLRCLTL